MHTRCKETKGNQVGEASKREVGVTHLLSSRAHEFVHCVPEGDTPITAMTHPPLGSLKQNVKDSAQEQISFIVFKI